MSRKLVAFNDHHLFAYVSCLLVEREEGTRWGEETEGEGGGLLADVGVGGRGRSPRDAGEVAHGDDQQAAGGEGGLEALGNILVKPAGENEDDGARALQQHIEDGTLHLAVKSAYHGFRAMGTLHRPVEAWEYCAASCGAGAEEPMLLLVEEGYVAEIGHYLFEYQRLFACFVKIYKLFTCSNVKIYRF